ncbi:MAG: DNA polymerase IV, partial [Gemmatimonadota bacterium]|nr:DNA polymerase IV [Gemmatimonadota bacterium]
LHIDADAFYCQVAYLTWPEKLAGVELLLVGGHPEKRGVVASCSYAARKRGARSAMPMATALRLCPEAVAVPVPWANVRRKSREVAAVLRRFTERLEMVSVDEGYALLPESPEPLEEVARRIQQAVKEETRITVSIGGGTSKLVAKLATSRAKPAGVYTVPEGGEYDFVGTHALGDLPYVGPAFLRDLEKRGISSIEAARRMELNTLTLWLGPARARYLWASVRAVDRAEVSTGDEPRKSISSETTFERDLLDPDALGESLRELVADVGRSLRKIGYRARTVTVKTRGSDFQDRQKNRTLPQAVETDAVILGVAAELLAELREARPGPVRLLGVGLSSLEGPGSWEQLTFVEIVPPLETDDDRRLHAAPGE